MAPKVQRDRRNTISITGIAVGLLFAALAAYLGFLAGAHHSGALTDTHQHPAACTTRNEDGAEGEASPSHTTNSTVHAVDALSTVEKGDAINEAVDSEYITTLKNEIASLTEAAKAHAAALKKAKADKSHCPKCPPCPLGGAKNVLAPDRSRRATEATTAPRGTGWKAIESVDSMALHELLMPNFPPRKDSNQKVSVVLSHGLPRPEYFPAEEKSDVEGNHGTSSTSSTSTAKVASADNDNDDDGLGIWQSSAAARRQVAKTLSACDEVSVVLTKGDGKVCLAVLENYEAPPFHVFRLRRRGTGATQSGKKGSSGARKGDSGSSSSSINTAIKAYPPEMQWVHSSRYENKEGGMPQVPFSLDGPPMRIFGKGQGKKGASINASALLLDFLNAWPQIESVLAPLASELAMNAAHPPDQALPLPGQHHSKKKLAGSIAKGPVVVLAVNGGVLDLVLNFLCSAKRLGIGGHGRGGDIYRSMLAFAGDDEVERAMASLGVATYRHPALGSFPSQSARGYGDDVFTSMMWLKVVSVYAVLRTGHDVLFQDADVIWWRDPRPFFAEDHLESPGHNQAGAGAGQADAYFQNDGARSQRYAPFSANTGFYYLRSTPKARLLMHDLLHSYNLIAQWKSHQHVLCQLLVEHYSKTGLSVHILPHRLFSIGQQYHRKKDFMRGLVDNTLDPRPYVFHWSWTAGKHEKLAYSKETGMWYLQDKCDEAAIRNQVDDASYLLGCCAAAPSAISNKADITGAKADHPFLILPNTLPSWATDESIKSSGKFLPKDKKNQAN